jgi:hypothetical protein
LVLVWIVRISLFLVKSRQKLGNLNKKEYKFLLFGFPGFVQKILRTLPHKHANLAPRNFSYNIEYVGDVA